MRSGKQLDLWKTGSASYEGESSEHVAVCLAPELGERAFMTPWEVANKSEWRQFGTMGVDAFGGLQSVSGNFRFERDCGVILGRQGRKHSEEVPA